MEGKPDTVTFCSESEKRKKLENSVKAPTQSSSVKDGFIMKWRK